MKIKMLYVPAACLACFIFSCSLTPQDSYDGFPGDPQTQRLYYSSAYTSSSSSVSYEGIAFLISQQDRYHRVFPVFDDPSSGGNHFDFYAALGNLSVALENRTNGMHSGQGCLRITLSSGYGWGGSYFLNGILTNQLRQPVVNWGKVPNAGINLSNAQKLTFWAKGKMGGERVEFFVGGVGRDSRTGNPVEPYPDSSKKTGTGTITLTADWQQYTIWLTNCDMSYVLGGFGWAAAAKPLETTVFDLDDVQYVISRLTNTRLLTSYVTISSTNDVDLVLKNVAYVYDNALALLAFLNAGYTSRAKNIADAFVHAIDHDRYYTDGRIRNAYKSGDLMLPPGWTPNGQTNSAALPGWWDVLHQNWYEDKFCVSTHTGNVAWVMLALLAYYQKAGGAAYLEGARKLGNWVELNTRDSRGAGGYTGGFEGWEPSPKKLSYKSTEHNLDLYAAFLRLHQITADARWLERARNASNFVMSMWDNTTGRFFTGTASDGVTPNRDTIPTDCQSWTLLSLRLTNTNYFRSLAYAEHSMKVPNAWGFDFNTDRDGIWFEGTAQMATALKFAGQHQKSLNVLNLIGSNRNNPSGGWYATSTPWITTGFNNADGSSWLYYRREHVGATAWVNLAFNNVNAFWLGTPYGSLGPAVVTIPAVPLAIE